MSRFTETRDEETVESRIWRPVGSTFVELFECWLRSNEEKFVVRLKRFTKKVFSNRQTVILVGRQSHVY